MRICPKCGAKLQEDWRFCMNCSSPVESYPAHPPASKPAGPPVEPKTEPSAVPSRSGTGASVSRPPLKSKFTVLRIVSDLLKVVAVIEVIGGLLFGVALMNSGSNPVMGGSFLGGVGGLLSVVFAVFGGVYTWAVADFISVALAIEENTRALRLSLK